MTITRGITAATAAGTCLLLLNGLHQGFVTFFHLSEALEKALVKLALSAVAPLVTTTALLTRAFFVKDAAIGGVVAVLALGHPFGTQLAIFLGALVAAARFIATG